MLFLWRRLLFTSPRRAPARSAWGAVIGFWLLAGSSILAGPAVSVGPTSAVPSRSAGTAPSGATALTGAALSQDLQDPLPVPPATVETAIDLLDRGEKAPAAIAAAEAGSALAGTPAGIQALIIQARALAAEGQTDAALGVLDSASTISPTSDTQVAALLAKAVILSKARNCSAALGALRAGPQLSAAGSLEAYVALEAAACSGTSGDWQSELSSAQAALEEPTLAREARIDAYEKIAEAEGRLGHLDSAFDADDQALSLASTDSYRALMLLRTGQMALQLGRNDVAADRLRQAVVDDPKQPAAMNALRDLTDMGQDALVSPYQAGLVYANAGSYARAIALFDKVEHGSPDRGAAQLARAGAEIQGGSTEEGIDDLLAVADAYPAQAGEALLQAGLALEKARRWAEAEGAYAKLQGLDPASPQLAEVLLRLGYTRYVQGDNQGALAAWQNGVDPTLSATADVRASVYLWMGKGLVEAQGADSGDARAAWRQATNLAPDTFPGLRAADLLAQVDSPIAPEPPPALAGPTVTSADVGPVDVWLRQTNSSYGQVVSDLSSDPRLQRANQLLDVGLRAEAVWEIDDLVDQFATAKDEGHLVVLGAWALERGLPDQAMRTGEKARDASGDGSASLPGLVWKEIYPAGFSDLVGQQAHAQSVDPFLLLALIRQESSFDPTARSAANAIGLTQIVPSTGNAIAESLGEGSSFTADALTSPVVNIRFGTAYLDQMLKRYGGHVLPAIAAYNGGAGNVDQWLVGSGYDSDVFVEQIPFAETRQYVKLVYQNYRLYERLFGSGT